MENKSSVEVQINQAFEELLETDRDLVDDVDIDRENLEDEFLHHEVTSTYWLAAASQLQR